ncbi:MAG: extracellular solute-binding protein [Romboutsia timonensis]|uniref:extracellular solute-binding protein n=1 Tax=Romboutsia timonensis TaxID=1776391 RepID=UPI0039903B20
MKKKITVALLTAAISLSLVACSNKENVSKNEKLEDTVVVYTTHKEEMLEAISDEFTKETGINVEFINLKGELADRVRSEKDNPQADVMFGGDTSTYMQLKEEGLYEKTEPQWKDELDKSFKDSEGYWYGTIKTPVMMFYNKDLLSADKAPKDWSDLTKEEYKDLIVTRDSLSSSMRSTVCALIENNIKTKNEDAAWKYLTDLDKNIKNYYNSGSVMYSAIGKGEAAISIAVLSDIIDNKENNKMPLEIVDAESGSVVITDCVAALKNAPHPNAAAKFVDFVGSAKVQAMIANDFNRIPTLDSALKDSPAWMATDYKAMDVDWDVIGKNQSKWIEKWETDIIDNNKVEKQ